jgi:hypothetical protein
MQRVTLGRYSSADATAIIPCTSTAFASDGVRIGWNGHRKRPVWMNAAPP